MDASFKDFVNARLNNLNTAVVNLFMFMPHFFSVGHSLKTLFQPWKNIVTVKKSPGFSFNEAMQRFADNMVSRLMGSMARGSIISSYLCIQAVFLMALPFVYIVYIGLLPLKFLIAKSQPTEEEKKKKLFDQFIKNHLADVQDTKAVEEWFNSFYNDIHQKPWWHLDMLMKQPPLGRDLTAGYTPNLDKYTHELTHDKPHYKHLVGRNREIDTIQQILSKSGEANVILAGEPGTGRFTVVEALAKVIYEGRCNPILAYRRILELNMEKILSEHTDSIKREEFLAELLTEAVNAKNIILCIPNFERYVADEKEKINLTTLLEKFAQLPSIQFIGITTPYHYQKFIQGNKTINGLFEKVDIVEPTAEETLKITLDEALDYERRYKIFITYEAVKQAVVLSGRYISDKPFPEKAIHLLDETCVYVQQHVKERVVTSQLVGKIIENLTHIPTELSASLKDKLLNIENELRNRIVSQDEAIAQVAGALRKAFVLVGSGKKPISSFLFLGPTGVGKTETAKAITQVLFNDEHAMLRFDMSLYQTIESIPTLVGSPQSGEPGLLSQAVRQQKFGTLLLDEIEKAHQDLLNIFLTVLDEGYFTDGFGNRVDCTHLVIIATSNAGADFIYQTLSAATDAASQASFSMQLSQKLIDVLVQQRVFSPEFLNRFDGVIVYKPLFPDAVYTIAQRMLQNLQIELQKTHGISVEFSQTFIDKLIKEGYDARFGARNMQRIIHTEVEGKIAQMLLTTPQINNRKLIF